MKADHKEKEKTSQKILSNIISLLIGLILGLVISKCPFYGKPKITEIKILKEKAEKAEIESSQEGREKKSPSLPHTAVKEIEKLGARE